MASISKDNVIVASTGSVNGEKKVSSFGTSFDTRFKTSIGSVFNHGILGSPVHRAILEITDNSASARDDTNSRTIVKITVERDSLTVVDKYGKGGDIATIKRFNEVGAENKQGGNNVTGCGAKVAAWFLANNLRIKAKLPGETVCYVYDAKGFGSLPFEQTWPVETENVDDLALRAPGVWEIELSGINRVHKRDAEGGRSGFSKSTNGLNALLGEVYRPLLKTGIPYVNERGEIRFRSDKIKLTLTQNGMIRAVEAMELPVAEGYSDALKVHTAANGRKIIYWVGAIPEEMVGKIKPGVRCYLDGRLVEYEYFGHNKRDHGLDRLTGEIFLEKEDIGNALTINKSAGIGDHPDLKPFKAEMHDELNEVVNRLLNGREEKATDPEPPKRLKEIFNQVSYLTGNLFRENTDIFKQDDNLDLFGKRYLVVEETPPTPPPTETPPAGDKKKPETPGGEKKKPPIDKPPRDPPPTNDKKIIKFNPFDSHKWQNLGSGVLDVSRLEFSKEEGVVLVLNNGHPAVRPFTRQNDTAVTSLVATEFANHIAREVRGHKGVAEFEQLRDWIRFRLATMIAESEVHQIEEIKLREISRANTLARREEA